MSTGIDIKDWVKTLPAVADATGLFALLADANGELSLIAQSLLTRISLKSTEIGAHLAGAIGIHLIFSYSKSDVGKYLVSIYIRKDGSGNSESATWIILKSNILVQGDWNRYGTINISGADDIVHKVLTLSFAMS